MIDIVTYSGQQREHKEQRQIYTAAVGRADAGVTETRVSQTGCGDGDHWGGQRLTGLTAAQPLVILKITTKIVH